MFPSADQLLPFTAHNSVEETHNQTIFYSNLGQNYRIVHDVMCWLTARLVVVSMVLTCIHRVSAILGYNPSQQIRANTMISPRTVTRGQLVSVSQAYACLYVCHTPNFTPEHSAV